MINERKPDWSDPALVMVQTAALAGFLNWVVGHKDAWAAFTAETGVAMPSAPRNQLERMIDDATGHAETVMRRFVAWGVSPSHR